MRYRVLSRHGLRFYWRSWRNYHRFTCRWPLARTLRWAWQDWRHERRGGTLYDHTQGA